VIAAFALGLLVSVALYECAADEPRPPRRAGDLLRVIALWAACVAAVALTLIATGVRP
jgi:hypothetical protein